MTESSVVKTGVEGLDDILLGGIPKTNVIMVQGAAGTGKTLLGTEFVYRGITEYNEPGMIVVFETSPDKLIRDASQFGWNLDELQRQDKLKIVFTSPQVFELELRSPDSLLLETAAEIKAQRIFIDGIGLLRPASNNTSPPPWNGPGSYRELLQQLLEGLHRENLTGMFAHELGFLAESQATLEMASFLADTVIEVSHDRRSRVGHRSLEIVKSRGQNYVPGKHTLQITSGQGLQVFRRVQAPVNRNMAQPTSKAKRSIIGVQALDDLIGGGLYDGSTTMVVGISGAGKTVLGTQLLCEGAAKEEKRGLLISLDEHPAQIIRNAETIGLDLQTHIDSGMIHIFYESPQELEIDAHFTRLVRTIEQFNIQRLVIDGVTSYSTALDDQRSYRDFFHALVAFTKFRLMTTFFNYENPELFGLSSYMPDFPVSSIVDNIILLSMVELGNTLHRSISVVKARGCKHEFDTREFTVAIDLGPIGNAGAGLGLMQIRDNVVDGRGNASSDPGGRSQEADSSSVQLTPEFRAELLDPEGWGKILELYARTVKLAVALIDADGRLVGTCHNPQPIWRLARDARPEPAGGCLFCLETSPQCSAAEDALRTGSLALAHDQAGFAHVALPLTLGNRHVGTLLAGQMLDRYPEPLPLQRLAREFGLSPQDLWHLARQQAPLGRANLTVYGELLWTLGQTFLRDRYGAILQRRWAETIKGVNQELATVNSELQNLLDSTQIPTIFLDHQLRIKKFMPVGGSFVRLEAGDIGRHITDLGDRFAEAGLVDSITEVIRTLSIGSSQDYPVVRERDLTGEHGEHYLMRILPYRAANRVIDGVVITFIDVTQLKEAEQLAANAKVYAENIVATVRQPLLVLDDKFRVHSANDAFYDQFQVRADETEGQLLYELGNGQWNIPELRRLLSELLPRDQWVEDFEMQHDFARIGPKTMVLNARRIDHVDLILLAIEDITERKLSEDLLRKLNLDLKNFSYAASHDLQEPLRMVTSYTQLLAREYKGKLNPQADQFIGYAVEGAHRMETLLRDLREYWLVNERMEERVPIECVRVLQKAIQALRVPLEESGASVTYDALPTVAAEEVSLAMLFQNLLSNANKYRRRDQPPRVHVSAEKKANVWCFSVKDNGIGIEAEYLEAVFAPFKRLHGKDYPGSGIGLAICKKIVERYGGRLWVESVHGQGSTFYFTIPV